MKNALVNTYRDKNHSQVVTPVYSQPQARSLP